MNDLSDDERNLLRYYAEQSASSMGWCECPHQHLGEVQARYVVGSREGLTPDLLWHDAGWARQQEFLGRPLCAAGFSFASIVVSLGCR
jgi:hypothetical protein